MRPVRIEILIFLVCQYFLCILSIESSVMILELRKKRLESMAEDGDVDTLIAKLTDEARKCNIQRFRNAIKIKVI